MFSAYTYPAYFPPLTKFVDVSLGLFPLLPTNIPAVLWDTCEFGDKHTRYFQVAIRALGFEVKKADVLKILKDCDKEGKGKITFQDFNEISKFFSTQALPLLIMKIRL